MALHSKSAASCCLSVCLELGWNQTVLIALLSSNSFCTEECALFGLAGSSQAVLHVSLFLLATV